MNKDQNIEPLELIQSLMHELAEKDIKLREIKRQCDYQKVLLND